MLLVNGKYSKSFFYYCILYNNCYDRNLVKCLQGEQNVIDWKCKMFDSSEHLDSTWLE